MTSTGLRRRGTASIIGTLVFVGILFTSVMPMLLLMKQTDSYSTQKRLEANQEDVVKAREEVNLLVWPPSTTGENLTIKAINRSVQAVDLVRLWINDRYIPLFTSLNSNEEVVLGTYDVNPVDGGTYDIRVTTSRGSVFNSYNALTFMDDHWEVENLIIFVEVSSGNKVELYFLGGALIESAIVNPPPGGSMLLIFDVTEYGSPKDYTVKVKQGSRVLQQEDVSIDWPDGPPYKWVHA